MIRRPHSLMALLLAVAAYRFWCFGLSHYAGTGS
jgi:ABC-type uncharacterized transport system permease subunit